MREVGTLALTYGYPIMDDAEIERQMARHEERLLTGGKEPSMLVDIRHGRPVEVEAILGNAIRLAEARGVQVPLLGMLYTLTKARNFAVVRDEEWKPIARVE